MARAAQTSTQAPATTPTSDPTSDIVSEWAAIAARRADRAARAVADGRATSAQAMADALLCDTVARHLLGPVSVDVLMAMPPAMVNQVADAAELFDRVTKPRADTTAPAVSDALRRAAINAMVACTETLAAVHYAMVSLRHIPANAPTLRWRIPTPNERENHG